MCRPRTTVPSVPQPWVCGCEDRKAICTAIFTVVFFIWGSVKQKDFPLLWLQSIFYNFILYLPSLTPLWNSRNMCGLTNLLIPTLSIPIANSCPWSPLRPKGIYTGCKVVCSLEGKVPHGHWRPALDHLRQIIPGALEPGEWSKGRLLL